METNKDGVVSIINKNFSIGKEENLDIFFTERMLVLFRIRQAYL
jgi:hypothetical protein